MNIKSSPELQKIAAQFQIPGKFIRGEPFGNGHINDTYLVRFNQGNGDSEDYIVQRINHIVFKKPVEVMSNIEAILSHLRVRIESAGGDPAREAMTLIPSRENSFLYISPDQNYWRVFTLIENASSYQTPESQLHVYHAGKAFGNFQRLLTDFPVDTLHETILDFHNTPVRYKTFLAAVEADKHQRTREAEEEIDFVHQRAGEMPILIEHLAESNLPLRVTHNDTKFNNVMIDDVTGEGICIVDLDTVMPGSLLFDYGDAIRSITNTAGEDEPDLAKVHFDLETFENFTIGYLEATGEILTPHELKLLPFSARLLTLECGMRFLTDHLDGDIYFRTSRQGHNLDRCRTQFKLVGEMEANFDEMTRIVDLHILSNR